MNKPGLASLLIIALLISTPALSEITASVGEVKVAPFSVKGFELSKTYTIDKAYGLKHGREIAAPFRFAIPVMDDVTPYFETPVKGDSTLLKVSFATDDKQLIENIRFVPFQVEMIDRQKRIHTTASLLANQGFQMATASMKDVKRLAVVQSEIGGHDAAVVVGQYTDPALGLMYVRLVGIINPDARHSILMFANFNPKLSAANAPDKLHKDGITYKIIESLTYLKQEQASGRAWQLRYFDGSGNSYSFRREAGSSAATFDYKPVTAKQSSSGVYSGGDPASGTLTPEQETELLKRVASLETDTQSHTTARTMGSGSFRHETDGNESAFVVNNGQALRDFNAFLGNLRKKQ
jgi:hypothetical protein